MGCLQSTLNALRQEEVDLNHSIASLKATQKKEEANLKQQLAKQQKDVNDAKVNAYEEISKANVLRDQAIVLRDQETERKQRAKKDADAEEARYLHLKKQFLDIENEHNSLSSRIQKLKEEEVELKRQADLIEARVEESLAKLPEGDGARSYNTILRLSLASRFKVDIGADLLCEASAYFNAALHSGLKLDKDADGCIYLQGNPHIWKTILTVISGGIPEVSKDSLLTWKSYLQAHPHYVRIFRHRFYTCLEEGKKRTISQALKPFDTGEPHRWKEVEDALYDLKMFALAYGAISEYYILSSSLLESVLQGVFNSSFSSVLTICDAEDSSIRREVYLNCMETLLPPSLGPYQLNIPSSDIEHYVYGLNSHYDRRLDGKTWTETFTETLRNVALIPNAKQMYLEHLRLDEILDSIHKGQMSLMV